MQKQKTKNLSVSPSFGVSFSLKQCRSFNIEPKDCLEWLLATSAFSQVRLMSYWNEHQPNTSDYDFTELDWQIDMAENAGVSVTLCLGARQPRWPENHWPDWAWELDFDKRSQALLSYVKTVVKRYKDRACVISYQLENEALLREFGQRPEVDRFRLNKEFNLVKTLDPSKPVIMTTSTSWGIPVRQPIPDIIGFSYYQVHFNPKKLRYTTSFHTPFLHRVKGWAIRLIHRKPSFIHELQLEPWGPANIWDMSNEEQAKSMSTDQIEKNIKLAKATGLKQIDLWGGEWWYWRKFVSGDSSVWEAVRKSIAS